MDVTLKVLEGGKAGTKIAVKRNEFIIGRSQGCHLCAGSTAISRQHCAILRNDNRVTIKDLGSRNGTLVNGLKIAEETELTTGDEIVVGPLKFEVAVTAGLNNVKKPQVKSVAEAVDRAAESASDDIGDDDISKWLLGPTSALTETQTIRMDDTNAIQKLKEYADAAEKDAAKPAKDALVKPAPEPSGEEAGDETPEEDAKASTGKSGPGKLPSVPAKPSAKDSREAAAEALRAWSRRR